MINTSDIRKDMEVYAADGVLLGTVDHVDGDSIKLARKTSADGQHHYVPLSSVARVDSHVHLIAGAAALVGTAAYGTTATVAPAAAGKMSWLPWALLAAALLLALLLFKGCARNDAPVTTATTTTTEAVTTTGFNDEVSRYLASGEAAPRTFVFDKLNFDTSSAAIRAEDQPTVDTLAQTLAAHPAAKVKVVGYADARGTAPANATLGQERAAAVATALAAKGIAGDRVETASGGESDPADTNATAPGRAENRRTELVVTSK